MTTMRVVAQMVRADLLERTRQQGFLVTLVLMIFLAYVYVPAPATGYISLSVDGARGVYNSAWVGCLVAILTALLMPLLGFYLVKNAVARDRETGVGQIIATTPLRRPFYTLGKWLSNLAALAAMVGMTALAASLLQLALGEDRRLDLVALWSPFLWVVLPAMAVIAALAVLFETIDWLRGGLGNVIYFFLFSAFTAGSLLPVMLNAGGQDVAPLPVDALGIGHPLSAMLLATVTAIPGLNAFNNSIGPVPVALAGPLQTFAWEGMPWTLPVIASRLVWVGVGVGVALLAALFFDRFDPARERPGRQRQRHREPVQEHADAPGTIAIAPAAPVASPSVLLPSLTPARRAPHVFGRVLLAEARLLLSEVPWWWYVVMGSLMIAGLLAPADVARRYLLPAAWLWPILLWSALGAREARHHTAHLVFSTAHPLRRHLPAAWLAGVLATALAGSGVAINLLVGGDGGGLLAWAVAAMFIPALALALANWSGGSKLFEVTYLSWWYFGPMNQIVPHLDFMGLSDAARAAGAPSAYLAATLVLLGVAAAGRRRQIRG